MIRPLKNQSAALAAQVCDMPVAYNIFLKQVHAGLEPGWPAWQTDTLTIVPPPHLFHVIDTNFTVMGLL